MPFHNLGSPISTIDDGMGRIAFLPLVFTEMERSFTAERAVPTRAVAEATTCTSAGRSLNHMPALHLGLA